VIDLMVYPGRVGQAVMPVTINGQTYYRTAEVYRMIGISRNTLYRWLQHGVLGEREPRDGRGWRLFTQDEVDALKAETVRINTFSRLR
jgi:predicted site-specific integrase-resolvase